MLQVDSDMESNSALINDVPVKKNHKQRAAKGQAVESMSADTSTTLSVTGMEVPMDVQ